MKFTSHTRVRTRQRCPRRFFLRYLGGALDPTHAQRKKLMSIPELGGWAVHGAMAAMVRTLAAGEIVDLERVIAAARSRWGKVVKDSWATPVGRFNGETQLAESFNGAVRADCQADLDFWYEALPMMLENGFRASASLGIRREDEKFSVLAEQERIWKRSGRTTFMVMDVLMTTPYRQIVVDWKCHSIEPMDLEQVRLYMEFLHRQGQPVSQLSGFAVDLLREEITPVTYNPYNLTGVSRTLPSTALKLEPVDSYPAKPDMGLCRSCAFAALCESAEL